MSLVPAVRLVRSGRSSLELGTVANWTVMFDAGDSWDDFGTSFGSMMYLRDDADP